MSIAKCSANDALCNSHDNPLHRQCHSDFLVGTWLLGKAEGWANVLQLRDKQIRDLNSGPLRPEHYTLCFPASFRLGIINRVSRSWSTSGWCLCCPASLWKNRLSVTGSLKAANFQRCGHSQVQGRNLVQESGVHGHVCASPTRGCAFVYFTV